MMFTFDDVLIKQKYSDIFSRSEVELTINRKNFPLLELPVIAANMDTVMGSKMARAMAQSGGIGCLHRFCTIEENMETFYNSVDETNPHGPHFPLVSIGLGEKEIERAEKLFQCGAWGYVLDVAHGSQLSVVNQVKRFRNAFEDCGTLMVGNFSNADCVLEFLDKVGSGAVDSIKVGVGPGSACTTRINTGVGYPQLSAILEIAECLKNTDISVVADGGMKTPGDIAKALGAGAHAVMIGGMLAGTEETPGEVACSVPGTQPAYKKYRGSASKESYELQGKDASWRGAEGESFMVPYKGPVKNVLQEIETGIRSAMTYTGSRTIAQFHERCEFVRITPSTVAENGAHGKKS